ncbi:hypothetical protein D322_1626 [Yersinia enterocolitica IP 10393]|nr:hypothetical protein D322_1626 [Yersinia enterocolitica IP 10393]
MFARITGLSQLIGTYSFAADLQHPLLWISLSNLLAYITTS